MMTENERPPSTGAAWVGTEYPAGLDPKVDTWNGQRVPATLTDFLLARIAEDEESARDADDMGEAWCWKGPREALAECEAKRRIVALHDEDARGYCPHECCGSDECPTLRALASVYESHPDFRDEWRSQP